MGNVIWAQGRYGGRAGTSGKLSLVSVAHSTQRSGPVYIVETTLPITIPPDLRGADTAEEAQVLAERLLLRFLRTIGARWRDDAS